MADPSDWPQDEAITQTEAVFLGQSNQTYYFRVQATDNAYTELAEV